MTTKSTLYQQVEAELRERIATGVYRSGQLMPSEAELCSEFGLSRITIRRALDGLSTSHLVSRQRGRGTLVADPDSITKTFTLSGYIEDAIPWNQYEVRSDEHVAVPAEILDLLRLPDERQMRCVSAINRPGGLALSRSDFYFPKQTAALVDARDFQGGTSIVRLIESRSSLTLGRAEQLVEATLPSAGMASDLGIDMGTPVLRTLRCFFSDSGEALQAVSVHHHPTRYRFHATLLPRVVPLRARTNQTTKGPSPRSRL